MVDEMGFRYQLTQAERVEYHRYRTAERVTRSKEGAEIARADLAKFQELVREKYAVEMV